MLVYAGSFDPVTIGHLNLISKAAEVFDDITILVLNNIDKNHHFHIDTRVKYVRQSLDECGFAKVNVESHTGAIDLYLKKHPNKKITLLRGLRNEGDFRYEANICQYYSDIGLQVVYMTPDAEFSNISSTLARYHLLNNNQDQLQKYLTPLTIRSINSYGQ